VVEAGGDQAADRDRLDALVDVLLAPLAPDLYQHQRDRGRSAADATAALTHLAGATLGRPAGDRGPADPGGGGAAQASASGPTSPGTPVNAGP
jgi:hypothetical protein